jgi:hypothetical protein
MSGTERPARFTDAGTTILLSFPMAHHGDDFAHGLRNEPIVGRPWRRWAGDARLRACA